MQATAGSSSSNSRRRSYNEGLVVEDEDDDDKLDKLAESSSSSAPVTRRLSTTSTSHDAARRMSISNGIVAADKGKSRMEEKDCHDDDDEQQEDQQMNAESELEYDTDDDESLHCAICLSVIDDRTVVQPCCHDAYCFVCILAWTEQSRRCPLCVANIELLIHNIRGEKDFQKHYLPPLLKSDSPPPERSLRELREGARRQLFNRPTHPRFKYADWKARNKPAALPDVDAEDLALEKRRYVYKYGLYVKHVASNRFTRFRDWSAQQVSTTPELKQRLAKWLRRELRVFDGVDLAFLVDYCTNIASQLELRSDSATRLLAEFLGEEQAEHFWHETYSFLRSPFKDIRQYDKAIQYDRPPCKVDEMNEEVERQPQSSKARRSRSYSVSSQSDVSSRSHRSVRPTRRGDAFRSRRDSMRDSRLSRPRSPPRRIEGDSYIPSYSKLNKPRPPARKRADRRPSRPGPVRRGDNGWKRQRIDVEDEERQTFPKENVQCTEAPKAIEPPHESDMEDIISLGESDVETAPLVSPKDAVPTSNAAKQAGTERQPAIAIRGIAQNKPEVNKHSKEVDLIRDFGPDLLSRLSGPSETHHSAGRLNGGGVTRSAQPQMTNSNGIQMKGRGFRRGTVNSEMHATLMARLNEEKLRSANIPSTPASPQPGKEVDEATEASLREHVLQVLKQRRQQKVQPATNGTDDGEASKAGPVDSKDTSPPLSVIDKTSRAALLQARLARERAAVSPPIPTSASTSSLRAADTASASASASASAAMVKTASPTAASDAAQRMAELKKRLAEQKAVRQQTLT